MREGGGASHLSIYAVNLYLQAKTRNNSVAAQVHLFRCWSLASKGRGTIILLPSCERERSASAAAAAAADETNHEEESGRPDVFRAPFADPQQPMHEFLTQAIATPEVNTRIRRQGKLLSIM